MKLKTRSFLVAALAVLIGSVSSEAATFNAACPDLGSCLKAVSALTGDQYIYNEKEMKVQPVQSSQDLELTAANADLLLTTLLNSNNICRVPSGAKMYVIMRVNDAKGMALPVFHASQTETPDFPDTWDLITLKYKATYPDSVKHMENIIRTYANMGARIYGVEQSGYLIITDNARNVKNMLSTMRENDVKISPALQKRWAAQEEIQRKEAAIRFKESLKDEVGKGPKTPTAPTPPTKKGA